MKQNELLTIDTVQYPTQGRDCYPALRALIKNKFAPPE